MKKLISAVLTMMICLCPLCLAQAQELTDGEYFASGEGRNGPVTLQMLIKDGKIEHVAVTEHSETEGLADPAIERLPELIVASQSVCVDVVSGATMTSNAILSAAEDCIAQAGGDASTMQPVEIAAEKKLVAGTYQGTGHGHHSDIVVEMAVTENSIESVKVISSGDNINIGNAAISVIPGKIEEYQSIAVDTVTGATYTSRAILSAVEDCLRQAGGEEAILAFNTPIEKAERNTEEKTETADVVIVGSGLTGVTAALAAQEQGADVVILEKLSYYGGISQTSAGCFKISTYVDEDGVSDYYKYLLYKSTGLMQDDDAKVNSYPNEEACRILAEQAKPTGEWLESLGIGIIYQDMPDDMNGRFNMGFGMFYDGVHSEPDNCAAAITEMVERFLSNGGRLYLETPVTALVTDESGAVVGVKAEGKDGNYTFECKAVALCCGGFGANAEMIAELAPAFKGETVGATGIGNTGDGIRMAREIGAAVETDNFLMGGSGHTFHSDYDNIQPFADAETPKASLYVNPMGQRVNSEDPLSYTPAITYCNPDAEDYYWAVMNEDVANTKYYENAYFPSEDTCRGVYIDLIREALENGKEGVYKADTVAELAKMMGVVPSTLEYTLARYNKLCRNGVDEDLGKNAAYLIEMTEGPWYAVKADMEFFGTVGGLVTDVEAAVLREDGTQIQGLFAAGETSNHKVLNMSYSGGVSVSENLVFGKIAGDSAAKAAGFAK